MKRTFLAYITLYIMISILTFAAEVELSALQFTGVAVAAYFFCYAVIEMDS